MTEVQFQEMFLALNAIADKHYGVKFRQLPFSTQREFCMQQYLDGLMDEFYAWLDKE